MVKKLHFTIDPEGMVSIQVEGASGSECVDFSRPFEEALGLIHSRHFKDEFYNSTHAESDEISRKMKSDS